MTVTTSQFLDSVKRGVTIPSNQVRFTNSDILAFADEEMEAYVMPMITSTRQEFFVRKDLVPLVANQAEYKIPSRSVGRTLRHLRLITTDGSVVKDLSFVMPEDDRIGGSNTGGDPWAYTVRGDKIVILPTPTLANYDIEMYYELAPSKLVESDRTATVASFDLGTGVVTINATNSNFTTGVSMDIVDGESGNNCKAISIDNSNVSGTAITFTAADLPSDLAAGDYVTLENESSVLQIPNEVTQVLVQAVICRILEALGDYEGLNAAMTRLKKIVDAATQIITPRVESKAPVIINRNGLLAQRSSNRRWRYNL